jgi:hypothetical protein
MSPEQKADQPAKPPVSNPVLGSKRSDPAFWIKVRF